MTRFSRVEDLRVSIFIASFLYCVTQRCRVLVPLVLDSPFVQTANLMYMSINPLIDHSAKFQVPFRSLVVYRLVHPPVTRESGVRLPARET